MTAPAQTAGQRGSGSANPTLWEALRRRREDIFRRPYFDYFNIMLVVLLLAFFGVAMVMSASMSTSVADGQRVWATTLRQSIMVVLGFVTMWLALRMPIKWVRRFSGVLLTVAFILLIAVLIPGIGTGLESKGSQSWLNLGFFSLQPSEIAKVAIAVWGAHYLAGHKFTGFAPGTRYFNFIGVATFMCVLIILEQDIGMALTFLSVVFAILFFAGINGKLLMAFGGTALLGVVVLALSGGFRGKRFEVYFDALFGHFEESKDAAFQSYQGFLSLADGGLTGVGVGQSRAKWFYLPEAKNDFIFAIIGEELGLVGGILFIALFGWLGFIGFRIAMKTSNQFLSLLAATLTAGVVAQAFVNIGYVIGLLPVTGIQLPLISAGGTSAVITLAAMGLLANCARHEPETISAMANYGKPTFENLLRLPEPTLKGLDTPQRRGKNSYPRNGEGMGYMEPEPRRLKRPGVRDQRIREVPVRNAAQRMDTQRTRSRRGGQTLRQPISERGATYRSRSRTMPESQPYRDGIRDGSYRNSRPYRQR
ncbi:FtsW/RodA/SpoVE family cell cycle protein [Corynebacterium mustelae]|nr:putative peptidoglycan glycosyltransferase FtsW [Corynebacterium mustelae]